METRGAEFVAVVILARTGVCWLSPELVFRERRLNLLREPKWFHCPSVRRLATLRRSKLMIVEAERGGIPLDEEGSGGR